MTPSTTPATRGARPLWARSAIVMAFIVAVLVIVEAIDAATRYDLDRAGIEPRQIDGLDGILWAPFLHADWQHLFANLIPLVVLGFILLLSKRFLIVTAIVWIVSGLGVWLFAPSYSVTVGASGIIFGWLTYLLVRGIFNRDLTQIAIGVILFLVYGSVLWGVFPGTFGVSWQGHLFGAIGGVLAAWFLADRDRRRRPRSASSGPVSPYGPTTPGVRS